jgi:hypothetical protein
MDCAVAVFRIRDLAPKSYLFFTEYRILGLLGRTFLDWAMPATGFDLFDHVGMVQPTAL